MRILTSTSARARAIAVAVTLFISSDGTACPLFNTVPTRRLVPDPLLTVKWPTCRWAAALPHPAAQCPPGQCPQPCEIVESRTGRKRRFRYRYDKNRRLARFEAPGFVLTYEYDDGGTLVGVVKRWRDRHGSRYSERTRFAYDSKNLVTEFRAVGKRAERPLREYDYDKEGRLVRIRYYRKAGAEPSETTYQYDGNRTIARKRTRRGVDQIAFEDSGRKIHGRRGEKDRHRFTYKGTELLQQSGKIALTHRYDDKGLLTRTKGRGLDIRYVYGKCTIDASKTDSPKRSPRVQPSPSSKPAVHPNKTNAPNKTKW